jgi:hypothetical protein
MIMAKDKNQKKKTSGSGAQDQAENAHAQAENAYNQAEKDMEEDPELSDPDPTDDLDEGELARKDNSDEEALDYLERPRHGGEGHGGHAGEGHAGHADKGHGGHADSGGHSGKGKEK